MKKLLSVLLGSAFTLGLAAQNVPNSGTILAAAYNRAAKEKKNVMVIFHASWCGWCKKMDASLNDPSVKKYFDDNYVITHLTVQEDPAHKQLENRGADVFLAKYKADKAGLPFFLIMDKSGKKLGDSFVNDQNLGCPASETEVQSFIELLKKTSAANEENLNAVRVRFRQNEKAAAH